MAASEARANWNDLELYVIEEHIEDFKDGFISRRELLRRVTLITGSMAVTLALLPTLGCNVNAPVGAPATAASFAPSATALATAAATPFATPPAARTTDGVTVKENDPRISAGAAEVVAADGAKLIAYRAAPKSSTSAPGMLVIHENRGLTEHIKDVIRRGATAGFATLGIDLLSREGGIEKLGNDYSGAIARRPAEAMVADLKSALAELDKTTQGRNVVIGFCFGGGMVWQLVNAGANLKAAAPFYGPMPSDVSGLAKTKTAVFAVYAEQDTRITGTKDQMEAALKQSGTPYKITVYPGANHAFHNDTGDRYVADQAQQAWIGSIEWFRRYVAG